MNETVKDFFKKEINKGLYVNEEEITIFNDGTVEIIITNKNNSVENVIIIETEEEILSLEDIYSLSINECKIKTISALQYFR